MGKSPQMMEKLEGKRERVFEAVLAELQAKGFEGASINDIADRADMALSSLYRLFPDRSEVVAQAAYQAAQADIAAMDALAERGVKAMLGALYGRMKQRARLYRALFDIPSYRLAIRDHISVVTNRRGAPAAAGYGTLLCCATFNATTSEAVTLTLRAMGRGNERVR